MLQKLKQLSEDYKLIEKKLIDPEIISNQKEYVKLWKRFAELKPIVDLYEQYSKILTQRDDALEMIKDPDMKELAEEELSEAKKKIPELEEEIRFEMLPKDPSDDKNIIVEIRSAAWWDEAALFAWEIARTYMRYAEENKFKHEMISKNEDWNWWIKFISFEIKWEWAYSKFKYESWVHRVQRIPETETQWRVHTSTITVAIMPEIDEVDSNIVIRPDEIKIDTFRAQWAWGQHVNTTDSAVRIVHTPTWITVECQDWRSQHKNKEQAFKVLRSRLYTVQLDEQQKEQKDLRLSQVWSWDRSEKIRTYNFPQDRVTDHRIKESWNNIQWIMNWNLEQMFEKLAFEDKAKKLANFN